MRVLRGLIYFMGALAFFAMLAGYLGALHPAFDSFSAFRLHLAAVAVCFGVLLMGMRGFLGGASMVVAAGLAIWVTLVPAWFSRPAISDTNARYRLLQTNLRFDNATPKALIQLIARTRPDVIMAQEVTGRWREAFATIKSAYPYQLYCPAYRKIGDTAILSRRPFVDAPTNYCGGEAISVQNIAIGDVVVAVASVHLYWPWPHQQPKQVLKMQPIFEAMTDVKHRLITGDLNAPRWSHTARQIARFSNADVAHYKGGTWLAAEFPIQWAGWFGLAIDNLFSSGLEITKVEVQSDIGSDHLPMLIEFAIPARRSNENSEPMDRASV